MGTLRRSGRSGCDAEFPVSCFHTSRAFGDPFGIGRRARGAMPDAGGVFRDEVLFASDFGVGVEAGCVDRLLRVKRVRGEQQRNRKMKP
jgi:hypothetical protein